MSKKIGRAQLTLHESSSAPEASQATLADIEKNYGFIPNLYRVFAGSPKVLESYLQVADNLTSTSLSKQEQQIVLLAASVENDCDFCRAAHTMTSQMAEVSESDIEAVRNGESPSDPRLAAIARFTRHLVEERGFASKAEISRFIEAGFESHQILEVVLGISLKTLSNYTNHLADTPVNDELEQFA